MEIKQQNKSDCDWVSII